MKIFDDAADSMTSNMDATMLRCRAEEKRFVIIVDDAIDQLHILQPSAI